MISNNDNNICVPLCICISLYLNLTSLQFRDITKDHIHQALSALSFSALMDPTPLSGGIPPHFFRELEKANAPFSPALIKIFPSLAGYKSFSLNLFRMKISGDEKNPTAYLFPSQLSLHHHKSTHMQIDFLKDGNDLRPDTAPPKSHHVLSIPKLANFLAKRNPVLRSHALRYTSVCRRCLRVFESRGEEP